MTHLVAKWLSKQTDNMLKPSNSMDFSLKFICHAIELNYDGWYVFRFHYLQFGLSFFAPCLLFSFWQSQLFLFPSLLLLFHSLINFSLIRFCKTFRFAFSLLHFVSFQLKMHLGKCKVQAYDILWVLHALVYIHICFAEAKNTNNADIFLFWTKRLEKPQLSLRKLCDFFIFNWIGFVACNEWYTMRTDKAPLKEL